MYYLFFWTHPPKPPKEHLINTWTDLVQILGNLPHHMYVISFMSEADFTLEKYCMPPIYWKKKDFQLLELHNETFYFSLKMPFFYEKVGSSCRNLSVIEPNRCKIVKKNFELNSKRKLNIGLFLANCSFYIQVSTIYTSNKPFNPV